VLTLADREADPAQEVLATPVTEVDRVELDRDGAAITLDGASYDGGQDIGLGQLRHDGEVVATPGDGALRRVDQEAHGEHRLAGHAHELDEQGHHPDREGSAGRLDEDDREHTEEDEVQGARREVSMACQ
jgi:hypothetical protein